MVARNIAMLTTLAFAFCGGAAFAQELNQPRTGFYADPVMPDPVPLPPQAAPTQVPAEVATVVPASRKQAATACTARNPCAVATPAARG